MLYAREHGFSFVHIPKCAGMTIAATLEGIADIPRSSALVDCPEISPDDDGYWVDEIIRHPKLGQISVRHIPLSTMAEHFPAMLELVLSSTSFAVVREPRARFISGLMQRLREFKDYGAAQITETDLRREAREVVRFLDGRGVFADHPFIHVSRQVDYLDLDGRRVVTEVFPLGNLDALWEWLRTRFGLEGLHVRRANSSLRPKPALKKLLQHVRPVYRSAVPKSLREPIFALSRRAGLIEMASSGYSHIDLGNDVECFIADYYARDARAHEAAVARWTPAPATAAELSL